MSRLSKDEYYLNIALAVSKRSTCIRRRYGAVIVKDDVIVATGYNGSPRGEVNCCDCGTCQRENEKRYAGYEKCPAVHAEQNALLSVDRVHSQGATLYLACEENIKDYQDDEWVDFWVEDRNPQPCNLCKKMIKNAGIAQVKNKKGEVLEVWA